MVFSSYGQWRLFLHAAAFGLAAAPGRNLGRLERNRLLQGDVKYGKPKNAVKNAARWPNGEVPYVFDSSLPRDYQPIIRRAMENYHATTCIRFVPRTDRHRDYVKFMNGGRGRCYAYLGRLGGPQEVSIGTGCNDFAIALHEMGHALGFEHEHVRPDRDNYITIKWENIDPSFKFAYEKRRPEQVDLQGIRYDYLSIMHYSGSSDLSRTPIVTKDPAYQDKIGNARNFSLCDLEKINRYYKCIDHIRPDNPCAAGGAQKETTTAATRRTRPLRTKPNSIYTAVPTTRCVDEDGPLCEQAKNNPLLCSMLDSLQGVQCKKSCNKCGKVGG